MDCIVLRVKTMHGFDVYAKICNRITAENGILKTNTNSFRHIFSDSNPNEIALACSVHMLIRMYGIRQHILMVNMYMTHLI